MAAVEGNDRAILTARAGAARAKAVRAGFAPIDTSVAKPTFYMWSNKVGMKTNDITTVWTAKVR